MLVRTSSQETFGIALLVCLAAMLSASSLMACATVEGDRIYARDLAAEYPMFAALDPALEIGYAPRPGVTRVIGAGDLTQLALRHHIPLDQSEGKAVPLRSACFARPLSDTSPRSPQSRDIERGDAVSVEVHSGAAKLSFQTKAESGGRIGDSVLVRNPLNGRLFQAKVEGKGKVSIQR
jgi:hypothetical protein